MRVIPKQLEKLGFGIVGFAQTFVFTRALPLGNDRSLRTKILRSLLAEFPIFQVVWVYMGEKL
jgi:hypothetical protein